MHLCVNGGRDGGRHKTEQAIGFIIHSSVFGVSPGHHPNGVLKGIKFRGTTQLSVNTSLYTGDLVSQYPDLPALATDASARSATPSRPQNGAFIFAENRPPI